MHQGYKTLRDIVKTNPLALSAVTDKKLLVVADNMLPYSTGIEIEVDCSNHSRRSIRNLMPNKLNNLLMNVDIEDSEFKARIPKGINGLIALYLLSEFLKEHFKLNEKSGNHYHIDCTDIKDYNFTNIYQAIHSDYKGDRRSINTEWILASLDKWNYKGNYNSRNIGDKGNWVAVRPSFKTLEFRIGEMTFDYELLLKRIVSCQNITRKVKKDVKAHLKRLVKPKFS